MRPHRIRLSGAVIAAALLIAPAAHAASDGERVYMRCAACHLKSGAGVPGVLLSAEAVEACVREDFPELWARPSARPMAAARA